MRNPENQFHRGSASVIRYAGATNGFANVRPLSNPVFDDEASVRRLINRFPDPGQLRSCYETGPLGFELHRLLTSMG